MRFPAVLPSPFVEKTRPSAINATIILKDNGLDLKYVQKRKCSELILCCHSSLMIRVAGWTVNVSDPQKMRTKVLCQPAGAGGGSPNPAVYLMTC